MRRRQELTNFANTMRRWKVRVAESESDKGFFVTKSFQKKFGYSQLSEIGIFGALGTSPSSSTKCSGHLPDDTRQNQDKPQNINRFCGFFVPKIDDSGPSSDRKKTERDHYWWQISGTDFRHTELPPLCHHKPCNYAICSTLRKAISDITSQNTVKIGHENMIRLLYNLGCRGHSCLGILNALSNIGTTTMLGPNWPIRQIF